MKKATYFILVLYLLTALLPCPANAANDTISVKDSTSFNTALESVTDGGTIHIELPITLPIDFHWNTSQKNITITGETLDFSSMTDVFLGCNVTFKAIALVFAKDSALFANGNTLVIEKSVQISGEPTVYGGGKYTDVDSTNVALYSGTYTDIFGGGHYGQVNGDVNLYVGGRVNSDLKLSHKHTYCIYAAGQNGKIGGKVKLTFGGGAKANYIYGGALGRGSQINGGIEILVCGGQATSIYGGSRQDDPKTNIQLTMTGGTVEQVFGGCEHYALSGNVQLNLVDGTITRRVYGGCYNEVSASGEWSTAYYVKGDILLRISGDVRITFTTGAADNAIYAHSRQASLSDKENTTIQFADEKAYQTYKDKLGARDSMMQFIMNGVTPADRILNCDNEEQSVPATHPTYWYFLLTIPIVILITILLWIRRYRKKTVH